MPAGTNYVYQLHIIDSEIKARLEGSLCGLTAVAFSSNKLQNLFEDKVQGFPFSSSTIATVMSTFSRTTTPCVFAAFLSPHD